MRADQKITSLELDETRASRRSEADDLELAAAIRDLCADNRFAVVGDAPGPFAVRLGIADGQLSLEVSGPAADCLLRHALSLAPVRRLIRDYMLVRDSHLEAVRAGSRSRIEAIDVGRRALHDEGADALCRRLETVVSMDKATARRVFTLICALVPREWTVLDAPWVLPLTRPARYPPYS